MGGERETAMLDVSVDTVRLLEIKKSKLEPSVIDPFSSVEEARGALKGLSLFRGPGTYYLEYKFGEFSLFDRARGAVLKLLEDGDVRGVEVCPQSLHPDPVSGEFDVLVRVRCRVVTHP